MTRAPMVECSGLARTYGSGARAVVAIHGTSCSVPPGLRIAVVGSAGSGKSTLLRLLAGLDRPSAGVVRWPGLGGHPYRFPGRLGLMLQEPSLLPALDLTENVALPMLLAGASERGARERAEAALDRVGLAGIAGRLPGELSAAEAHLVALARALAARPRLLVVDDPTQGLDRAAGERLVGALLRAAADFDAALLLATGDDRVVGRLPVRWRLYDGRLSTGGGLAAGGGPRRRRTAAS